MAVRGRKGSSSQKKKVWSILNMVRMIEEVKKEDWEGAGGLNLCL